MIIVCVLICLVRAHLLQSDRNKHKGGQFGTELVLLSRGYLKPNIDHDDQSCHPAHQGELDQNRCIDHNTRN